MVPKQKLQILYINCLVCLLRDSYAIGSAFSVAEPASVYYCTWMINCRRVHFKMHPCVERMDGILEASFRRPLDTEKSDGPSTSRRS